MEADNEETSDAAAAEAAVVAAALWVVAVADAAAREACFERDIGGMPTMDHCGNRGRLGLHATHTVVFPPSASSPRAQAPRTQQRKVRTASVTDKLAAAGMRSLRAAAGMKAQAAGSKCDGWQV